MSLQDIKEKRELTERGSFNNILAQYSPKDIDLLKRQVAKNSTDDEFEYFLKIAKATNLNPFLKEIHFIKYKPTKKNPDPRLIIMTGRDGYLKIANSRSNFIGVSAYVVYENDEFTFDPMEQKINHKITFKKRGGIVGAYAIVHRNDTNYKQIEIVNFVEYYKDTHIWNSNPSAMIKKVAQSRALKFFANITGLVTTEEMGINTNTIPLKIKASQDKSILLGNPDYIEEQIDEAVNFVDKVEDTPKPKKPKKAPKKKPAKKEPKEEPNDKEKLEEEYEQYKVDRELARVVGIVLKHPEWKKNYYDKGIIYTIPEKVPEKGENIGELKTKVLGRMPWTAKAEWKARDDWNDGQFSGDVEPSLPFKTYKIQWAKENEYEVPPEKDLI